MAPKDLVTELRSGKSIANVATEKGVDPQKIIDDVVGAIDGKLDQRVADGKLDQAKADTMKQNLPQRVTDFVNKVWGQARAEARAKRKAEQAPPSTDAPATTEAPASTDTTEAPASTDTTQAPASTDTTEAPAGTSPGTTAGG